MWIYYHIFIYLSSNIYSLVLSYNIHPSNSQKYAITYPVSKHENILRYTEPPTFMDEMPMSITFYTEESLQLYCNITGNPTPTYQWYISTKELGENPVQSQDYTFEKIQNGAEYKLVINGKLDTKTYSKYIYYCSAHNSLGTLHSNKIIVEKVTRPTKISVKYTLHQVFNGQKFVAQCFLMPDLILFYKFLHWEIVLKSNENMKINHSEGRYSVIRLTRFPQLHIRNVTNDDFNKTKIRAVFQSKIGNRQEVVYGDFKVIERSTVGEEPYYLKLCCTDEVLTTAVNTNVELPWGSVPKTLNVTWYKINNLDPKNKIEIGNRDNDTKFVRTYKRYGNLLIMNVTKEDAGTYIVESTFKKFSITYILKVYEIPTIFIYPKNIRQSLFKSSEFNCWSTFPKNQFLWLHNGKIVKDGYDDGNVALAASHNASTLRIKKVRLSISGVFQCIVTFLDELKGLADYRQVSGTLLIPEVAPILIKQSPRAEQDSSIAQVQISKKRESQTIECVFAGNPRPNIVWYHNFNRVQLEDEVIINDEEDKNSIYNFITKITIPFDNFSNDKMKRFAGEYQAKASNSFGSTFCSTLILIDGPMDIRLPESHTAISGADYLLTCYFISMEVPEFSWDRTIDNRKTWETLPINHRTILIEKGYRLLIKNLMKAQDAGEYRCTLKYNKEIKSATTNLSVVYPPILQNLPTKHDSSESQTHICTIRSEADKPWYAWWTFTKYHSNETIIITPSMTNPLFSVYYDKSPPYKGKSLEGIPNFVKEFPNKGVDIYIKARSRDKKSFGKFVCHAKNEIGYDERIIKDIFLNLEFDITPPSSSKIVIGKDLYLDCTAKESDLNPVVKWRLLKEDGKYVDINDIKKEHHDRIFQFNNGTLVMKNAKEGDPSKLTCFIFPTGKNDQVQSKISYIEIRVPARIINFKKKEFKVSGTSFNISCDVYGHNDNLIVTWRYRPIKIVSWQPLPNNCLYSKEDQCMSKYRSDSGQPTQIKEMYNRTFNRFHLQFRDAGESISGEYKCEAINKFNIIPDQSSMTLVIISKPTSVIMDPIPREITSSSVSFEWNTPKSDGNSPILRYIINYHEIYPSKNNNKLKKMIQKTIRVNDTQQAIAIDQLRPYKKYRVSIAAENEVGTGEEVTMDVMTEEAKPQKSVNNLAASSNEPHEILISWDEPDPDYQNGRIIQYQMCYQTFPQITEPKVVALPESLSWPDNFVDMNQFPRVKCEDTKNKTITVSHLPQFTDFAIRIIAFNSKGASPALFTKVRTLEDLPREPPLRVTCTGQHQAIALHWDPPDRVTINGVLKGYMVYYYEPNKYRDESEMKSINVQERTSVTIDQLKSYTAYSIQIMAVNRKGFGPPSKSVVCHTKEAKAEAPKEVKAVKINSTCTVIVWLHTQKPNGHIREYCVESVVGYSRNQKCQPPDMDKRYNFMLRCDIYDEFPKVKVFARNGHDGAAMEATAVENSRPIISIGGDIVVTKDSSATLPCETLPNSHTTVDWKSEGNLINNSSYSNVKVGNNSLVVTSSDKYQKQDFYCSTDSDNIMYSLTFEGFGNSNPNAPIIDDSRVTENSVFIRWKSRGSNDISAPITGFIITWKNLYSQESMTVKLEEKERSFYLNNVTCGSYIEISIISRSYNGDSDSDKKTLRTLGSAPIFADSKTLLPQKNIESHSINFNLLAFGPGENCSAMHFAIDIGLTINGRDDDMDRIYSKNVTIYDLQNKCCYKVSDLNPATLYKYRITAYNPAGSVQTYGTLETLGLNGVYPGYRQVGTSGFGNQSWLLMIILIIVIIFILIIVVVGILYIVRSKEKKTQPVATKVINRKSDFNQNRVEKDRKAEDTISMDSEPSPYAVYQPDIDPKMGPIRPQQISQQNSTPLYNYTDHHYNQIRYDKIPVRRQMTENNHDYFRRANSAECLSSLGNASVTGVVDLESPNNIDQSVPQDYFRAPFTHCADSDEVFQNIQRPDFSTINKNRVRRESENLRRYTDDETARMMKNSANQIVRDRNRFYEPNNVRVQQRPSQHGSGTSNHHNYRTQMSVPEPTALYQQQYGFPSNRLRSISGTGRNHPSSQTVMLNNNGSSNQCSGYGSYYGQRSNNVPPHQTSSGISRDSEQANNQYSSYRDGSNLSNYNPPQRLASQRPNLERLDSPDEGIYTDRVVVV